MHRIEQILYKILFQLRFRVSYKPLTWFIMIFLRIRVIVLMARIEIAGRYFIVPVPVQPHKQILLPIRWLCKTIKIESRTHITLVDRILNNLALHYVFQSSAIKLVQNHHTKTSEEYINVHYRWQTRV